MRKLSLVALMALCFAFPGKVDATPLNQISIETLELNAEIDQSLVEQILRQVQEEYDYDFECLCLAYLNGEVTISKVPNGYQVLIQSNSAEGGVLLVIEEL